MSQYKFQIDDVVGIGSNGAKGRIIAFPPSAWNEYAQVLRDDGTTIVERLDALVAIDPNIDHDHAWKVLYDFTPMCECGKDKHGFMRHSQWCPIYE